LYLVRAILKADYRELRMPAGRHFREWAHSAPKVSPTLQPPAADVVTLRPRIDLKAGEYVLASVFEPGGRWIRLDYDFGLSSGVAGQ
jgi:hypothetical protein